MKKQVSVRPELMLLMELWTHLKQHRQSKTEKRNRKRKISKTQLSNKWNNNSAKIDKLRNERMRNSKGGGDTEESTGKRTPVQPRSEKRCER